jgi:glyoxylase I family protein
MMQDTTSGETAQHAFIKSLHGVRYQVRDVARSVAFYTQHLGFTLKHQQLPAFAAVSLGDTQILLSGPGASGSRPMPNGQPQEPGGWNRVVLKVADLPGCIAELKTQGVRFRNEMEVGPGGRQVQIEDPDGNPLELFEPARFHAEVRRRDVWVNFADDDAVLLQLGACGETKAKKRTFRRRVDTVLRNVMKVVPEFFFEPCSALYPCRLTPIGK